MHSQACRGNIVLIKGQVLLASEAHYAGGIHLFSTLAASFADSGYAVHVCTIAKKSLVLHHALMQGLLGSLQVISTQPELLTWTAHDGVRFWVAVEPERTAAGGSADSAGAAGNSNSNSAACNALIAAVAAAAAQLHHKCRYLLDVDALQHAVVSTSSTGRCVSSSACHGQQQQQQQQQQQEQQEQQQPFMYALLQRLRQQELAQLQPQDNSPEQQQQQQLKGQQQGQPQQHQPLQAPEPSTSLCLLVLVQNLHHLPFGPCGTAPRTPMVLQAWQQVSGMLCVSNFVANYMAQHALPVLKHNSSNSSGSSGRSVSSQTSCSSGSNSVVVVHPAAGLGAFGRGPFPDLGAAAAALLWGEAGSGSMEENAGELMQQWQQQDYAEQQQQQQQQQLEEQEGKQQQQQQQQLGQQEGKQQQQQQEEGKQRRQQAPVVGMLKLTREKGSDLFFGLAARLPSLQFLAVCADVQLLQQAAAAAGTVTAAAAPAGIAQQQEAAAAAGRKSAAAVAKQQQQGAAARLANLSLVPPVADVSSVLASMSVLLVPSVLHEAFGLVVVDAMLRGIPVIVSEAGALPEAAAGAAVAVVPVKLVSFPLVGAPKATAAAVKGAQNDERQWQQKQQQLVVKAATAAAVKGAQHGERQRQKQQQLGGCTGDGVMLTPCAWQACQLNWDDRVFPTLNEADFEPWVAALQHVLSSRDVYLRYSRQARAAAEEVVVHAAQQHLNQLLSWLDGAAQG